MLANASRSQRYEQIRPFGRKTTERRGRLTALTVEVAEHSLEMQCM